MIIDNHHRLHNYLRISLTDHCNLRCFYCMPEEDHAFAPASHLMQTREIVALANVFIAQGVNKIRLTGGEPLVRKDAADVLLALARPGLELTLTTNGTRVHQFIPVFQQAGIRSVNVSLDTLDPNKFLFITRRDQFHQVYNNMQLLLQEGFQVKVNVVVMKGLNEREINDFVALTKCLPLHIRFIEFMPFTGNRWSSNKVVTWQQILHTIQEQYNCLPLAHTPHETAKRYIVPGHAGSFAVISTMSAHFCGDCNRMRLTADGKMKNCLFSEKESDLLTALREGKDVAALIHQNIRRKAPELGGQLPVDFTRIEPQQLLNRSMIAIGG